MPWVSGAQLTAKTKAILNSNKALVPTGLYSRGGNGRKHANKYTW